MKLVKSKNLFSMIAVFLILSFVVSMIALPNANAQTDRATFPFVDAIPKMAGVGQPVLINWGLLNQLQIDGDSWNVTLQITYPNGKVENISASTWSTGTVGRKMSFSEPGNYTLQCFFDRVNYVSMSSSTALNGWYAESRSDNVTLRIVEGYWKLDHPGHSLPTEYWTRPVDSQLREWYAMMGSWVSSATTFGAVYTQARFNDGPESAHVLWSMPIGDTMGGLSGGETGVVGFQNGDAYEGKFAGSIILAGVLYYNRDGTFTQSGNITGALGDNTVANPGRQRNTIVAVDLHTGKILWEKSYNFGVNNDARITRGQVFNWLCLNNRGTWTYLWLSSGTTMYAIEPKTGDFVYNMTNVPGGTFYIGPNGEMLKYVAFNIGTTANPVWQLRQWNSSYVVTQGKIGMAESWGSQVQGVTYNADVRGWDRNMTLTGVSFLPGQTTTGSTANQTVAPQIAFPEDRVIFSNRSTAGLEFTGISLEAENPGYIMYNRRSWTAPKEWETILPTASQNGWVSFSQDEMIGIYWTKYDRVNYAFDLNTGRFLWQSEPQIYADAWTDASSSEKIIAYGKLYEASVGGIVYCYDVRSGELLWTYEATDKYNESYHGENWWLIITFITDGKVYIGHMVHSGQMPISRGAPFFCLDAETGELVWEINGAFRQTRWGGRAIIGDSIIATMDLYDQQIYAIGKGPSELTVSVSNAVTTAGSTILVTGTVMDVSPGTQSDNLRLRFPSGVPAVGDESQSEWMLYLYKQFSAPMNVKGIEVTVYAYDGQDVIPIGTTESDARGTYAITWTPDKEGTYEIWAYFEGTASFYGDDAKATMAVLEAPAGFVQPKNPPYEWYIVGAVIAIVAAIAIHLFITLKKK
ncbi:MAG: PQQ-binding-like beta-propeller repeat protein [Candidatus Bathyarchaeota archaeon]|nr:PQQ-binding-like beta-propeller repeat protein [Candidatus Termiticorpusculum sp.]